MTTISIADKNRLTVRGVMDGARYLVKQERNGWWIEPAPEARRHPREIKDAKKDLAGHLDALAATASRLNQPKMKAFRHAGSEILRGYERRE